VKDRTDKQTDKQIDNDFMTCPVQHSVLDKTKSSHNSKLALKTAQ